MKYQIKETTEKKAWDSFIVKNAPEAYLQSWDAGEVERLAGKKIYRLSVISSQSSVVGMGQIIKVKAKRGTFLHVRNGPIFLEWKKELFSFWLDQVKDLAKKEHASFIRVSPLISSDYSSFLSEFGFRPSPIHSMDGEVVSVLDVRKSEDELLQQMRKNTRYSIRKGIKMGVSVRESNDIDLFLKLHEKTFQRHHFVPHQAIRIEYEQFKNSDAADLLIAYHEEKPLAAAIICYFGNQAIYRHGASIQSTIPAAYVLQWEVIKAAQKRGIPFYNLYGISDSDRTNHPWWGLTLFKKGFGGETKHYLHAQDLPLSSWYKLNYIVETVRRKRKGYS